MERSDFIEALENRSSLSSQSKEDWEGLANKHAYSALVQLLNFERRGTISLAEKKRLALQVDNPLHLSILTSQFSVRSERLRKENNKKPEKIVTEKKGSEDSKEKAVEESRKKTRLTSVPKKKVSELKESIVSEVVEESNTKVIETAEPMEEKVEYLQAKLAETPKAKTAENDTPKVEEKDKDVLELINELPEESPIKRTEESLKKEEDDKLQKETAEDPGDLMVMMSFTDWLQYFKSKKENEEEDQKGRDAIRSAWQKEKLAEAMDDEEDVVPDDIFEKAMKSVSFGDGLVTEPLAELYVQQGKTDKAIELYKKLSLLNPEKRTYFASRIKDLHLLK